jgi:hypothetical protein
MISEQSDSSNNSERNGAPLDRDEELATLRETVKRLEQERDKYKTMMYAAVRSLFTKEELTQVPEQKDCLPLDAFIQELEAIVGLQ